MPQIFFFVLVFLDQLTKWYVRQTMQVGESIPILQDVFHLTYILNPGAAFGILPNQQLVFIFLGALILGCVFFFYAKLLHEGRLFLYAVMAFVAGTLGNLIDRIFFSRVVDFLDFRVWPIFNVADIAIVCGVVGIFYKAIFTKKGMEKDNAS